MKKTRSVAIAPKKITHACFLYEQDEDFCRSLFPILRQGLDRKEKVIVLSIDPVDTLKRSALIRSRLNLDDVSVGPFEVLPLAANLPLGAKSFKSSDFTRFAQRQLQSARKKGYTALILVIEMPRFGARRLADWETFLSGEDMDGLSVFCLYRKKLFSPSLLLPIIEHHGQAVFGITGGCFPCATAWDDIPREPATQLRVEQSIIESIIRNFEPYKQLADQFEGIGIGIMDRCGNLRYMNKTALERLGLTQEILDKGFNPIEVMVPSLKKKVFESMVQSLSGGEGLRGTELTITEKDERITHVTVFTDAIIYRGERIGLWGIGVDNTEHRKQKKSLKETRAQLEAKSRHLEELNTALTILLKKRDEERSENDEKILSNVKKTVLPYLAKLKKTHLDPQQCSCVELLDKHLNELISPFLFKLSSAFSTLTPKEIQVASLIRDGKSTKEIAELLNVSTSAIDLHRNHIRAKLGLANQKMNLRSHLLSLT
ncbi:MAG: MEDS domain-containing protein [Smithellaceae bacterium]|nr:MEDS domain-containing protein [Smithellaceae bacterium]